MHTFFLVKRRGSGMLVALGVGDTGAGLGSFGYSGGYIEVLGI